MMSGIWSKLIFRGSSQRRFWHNFSATYEFGNSWLVCELSCTSSITRIVYLFLFANKWDYVTICVDNEWLETHTSSHEVAHTCWLDTPLASLWFFMFDLFSPLNGLVATPIPLISHPKDSIILKRCYGHPKHLLICLFMWCWWVSSFYIREEL